MKVEYSTTYCNEQVIYHCTALASCCGFLLYDCWNEIPPISSKHNRMTACGECGKTHKYSLYLTLSEEAGAALERELL